MQQLTDGSEEAEPPKKKRRGRPDIPVDLRQLRLLAAMQLTCEEIAAVLGISFKEFESRRARKGADGHEFREAYDRGKLEGRGSLRRAQWKTAIGEEIRDEEGKVLQKIPPNPNMQVWLGKQYLGQRETFEDVGPNRDANFLWQIAEQMKNGPAAPAPPIQPKAESKEG